MRQKLEWVIKLLIYASFFVPLVVIPSSFIFPFIVPKVVIFRSLVEIMLGAYVLLLIVNWKEYKPDITPLTIAVFAFYIVSFGISTFAGVDSYHSFWDNHERMLGFFTIMHYFAYFILCSKFIVNWTAWKWAMRTFLLAGVVVMFIGFLQVGNPDLLLNQGSNRVASTLGNPIYVGGYGMFLTFMAALLILKDRNRLWKYIYGVLMIFTVLGIFFSGTRGSMLALLAGVGTVLLLYAVALRGYAKTRIAIGASLILLIIIVGILYANRQTDFVKNIPAVGRAANTSLSDVMASARWVAWEIAWKGFTERPFFGWGPNNFFYTFNLHYNPRSLDYGYGETWFDNAHNIVMNTLAVQGGVGIITYVGVFIVGFIVLVGAYRKQRIDIHLLAMGGGFLVAHFVGNVTVFENITSYLYFIFWLAMINQLSISAKSGPSLGWNKGQLASDVKGRNDKIQADKIIGAGALISVGIIAFVVIYIFNIQPARANMKTLDAIKALSSDPVLGYERMKIALEFGSPHIDDIRSDIGRTASQLLSSYGQKMSPDLAKNMANLAYDELRKNTMLHPLDVRNYISLAQLSQMKAYLENNGLYLQEAEMFTQKALEYSPRRQQLMYSLAMLKAQMNKSPEAVALLEQAIKDNSKVGESYWRLAYVYILGNRPDKAKEAIALGEKNNAKYTDNDRAAINQLLPAPTSTATATK